MYHEFLVVYICFSLVLPLNSSDGKMSTKVKFVVDGFAEQDLMLKAAQVREKAWKPVSNYQFK